MLDSKNRARTRVPLASNSAYQYLRGWAIKFLVELCDILIVSEEHDTIYFLNFKGINFS